mmetsp:Transcript_82773/g.192330  ORF Transcript_82773/g.192330 Transcript_82773/m.192330 type:complete len:258 (+) Transcript_82773:344-1117(+)
MRSCCVGPPGPPGGGVPGADTPPGSMTCPGVPAKDIEDGWRCWSGAGCMPDDDMLALRQLLRACCCIWCTACAPASPSSCCICMAWLRMVLSKPCNWICCCCCCCSCSCCCTAGNSSLRTLPSDAACLGVLLVLLLLLLLLVPLRLAPAPATTVEPVTATRERSSSAAGWPEAKRLLRSALCKHCSRLGTPRNRVWRGGKSASNSVELMPCSAAKRPNQGSCTQSCVMDCFPRSRRRFREVYPVVDIRCSSSHATKP